MRDLKVEQHLEGYTYTFQKNFPLDLIDLKTAEANPARLGRKVDPQRAETMGQAMNNGADFPGIVVIKRPNRYQLASGCHRLTAATKCAKPPLKVLDAYVVVENSDYQCELLTRTLNSIEGVAQGRNENLAHIMEMARQFPGHDLEECMVKFNMTKNQVIEFRHLQEIQERADEFGVGHLMKSPEIFPPSTKRQFNKIKSKPRFVGLVKSITATKINGRAATKLITDVDNAVSDDDALQVIKAHDDKYAKHGKRSWPHNRPDIPTSVIMKVKALVHVDQDPKKHQYRELPLDKIREARALWRELGEMKEREVAELTEIIEEHEKSAWKLPETTGEPQSENTSESTKDNPSMPGNSSIRSEH